MPHLLDIQMEYKHEGEKVKSVDVDPLSKRILLGLYSGCIMISDYKVQDTTRCIKLSDSPVRTAKFIVREGWIVAGDDDGCIRVIKNECSTNMVVIDAHSGYIRCIAVHESLPYVLSSSDDKLIKLWNWDKGWMCTHIFRGHMNYVMEVTFITDDLYPFASACSDGTVKIWSSVDEEDLVITLDTHSLGVNCVKFYGDGERSYLVTGSDDCTVKVWDYMERRCVKTLEGHSREVSAVCVDPVFSRIFTGSEDGTVCIWCSISLRLQNKVDYEFGSVWSVGLADGIGCAVIGYDEGFIMLGINSPIPIAAMDDRGKIIWGKDNKIKTAHILPDPNDDFKVEEVDTCDLNPEYLKLSPDKMYVAVGGSGEYIIYRTLGLSKVSGGLAEEFVWSAEGKYAVRSTPNTIKFFNEQFEEGLTSQTNFAIEKMYGGKWLIMSHKNVIYYCDWNDGRVGFKVDGNIIDVYPSPDTSLCAVATLKKLFLRKFNEQTRQLDKLGFIPELVESGIWFADSFIFCTNQKLKILEFGNQVVTTVLYLDRPMWLLGYLVDNGLMCLIDSGLEVTKYTIPVSLIKGDDEEGISITSETKCLIASGD